MSQIDRRLPTRSQPWIIGRRADLALVSGSSLASFFYIFFLRTVRHVTISQLW
jgi:hypothetical protein